jgi:hypothetical protein
MDFVAPEIEKPEPQPLLFGNVLRARHLKRQDVGG